MRILFSLSLFVLSFLSFGQGEANIWYFGHFAGIDFNSGSPVVLDNSSLITGEGCATISDSNGELLFYTNGVRVYNKNHTLMPNSGGLAGHTSSTQSAIIVPKPENPNIFYIFTTGYQNGNLCYSEVDLTLESGLGDVTENLNIELQSFVSEKLVAVEKSDNSGYWVIGHKSLSNEFVTYEVTASGVNATPIISAVGTYYEYPMFAGHLKISPDNSKLLAVVTEHTEIELFDFDNSTGQIANPKELSINFETRNFGAEFSPNGQVLYVSFFEWLSEGSGSGLIQFDLAAGSLEAINASQLSIINVSFNNFGALQYAPDGKIYVSRDSSSYIDYIEYPNVVGLGCNYHEIGLPLNGNTSELGLPNFNRAFSNTIIYVPDNCLGDVTSFELSNPQAVNAVVWDFGDGSPTSSLLNPTHIYASAGNYTVTATITNNNATITKSKQIIISEIPVIANTISDQIICGNNNMLYDWTLFNETLLGNQSTSTFGVAYFSNLTDAENHTNFWTFLQMLTFGTNTYYAKIYNLDNVNCNAITSFDVTFQQGSIANYTSDYIICEAEPYDNVEIFDLQTKTATILGTQSPVNFTVSYHASLNDAANNNAPLPLLYSNSLPIETIFARVQNNFNTDCIDITSFNIQVIQQPAISVVSDYIICDAFNDGVETFNLATKTNEILNGQSETIFEVAYFLTIDDATNGLNPILSPIVNTTSQQTIFYTIAAIGNNACASTGSFQIAVSNSAVANIAVDYYLCDIDNDGSEIFDLLSKNNEILGSQAASDFQITYHFSQNEADNATNPLAINYQNSSNPQTIYARIQSVTNVDCFETSFFEIGLDQFPIANACEDLFLCDDSNNDGSEIFDLQLNTSQILGNQSSTDFSISFHENQIDSETGNNPLPTLFTNVSNPQTIYVRIKNNAGQDCYDLTSFSLEVKPSLTIDLQESYTICEGVPITIFAPAGFSTYNWSTGANNNSTVINSAGLYSLTVTKDYGDIICTSTQEFEVVNSNIATILSIKTADWTANQNSITVYVEGDGDYEYSLDGITYQDSNQFFGLLSGEYTVFVNDKNECGNTLQDVFLLNYPKFFTPNGDGDNDYWRIKFSKTEPALEVSIFDRYGKIITVFKGYQLGWDGTYNG